MHVAGTDFDRLIDSLNELGSPIVSIQPATRTPVTHHRRSSHRRSSSISRRELRSSSRLPFAPTQLPLRAYYWNLIRAQYKTSANPSRRRYIRRHYGNRVYRRMVRGTIAHTWQYLRLMVQPG